MDFCLFKVATGKSILLELLKKTTEIMSEIHNDLNQ